MQLHVLTLPCMENQVELRVAEVPAVGEGYSVQVFAYLLLGQAFQHIVGIAISKGNRNTLASE